MRLDHLTPAAVQAWLAETGTSQTALATAAGITRVHLHRWLHGQTDLSLSVAQRLASTIKKSLANNHTNRVTPDISSD